MANSNDILRKVYQNASRHFTLPDFETFERDMKDEEKRRSAYEKLRGAYDLPDFDTFSKDIGAVAAPAPAQPAAEPQAAVTTVEPITDTTAIQASGRQPVQTAAQTPQPEGWKPTAVRQRAFEAQVAESEARLKKQGEDFQQRMEGIGKGNKPGAFMGEREFNPSTGEMEKRYYTLRGESTATPIQQSAANTEHHKWWEDNTEEGRRSKEQRLQREFDDRLSRLWDRPERYNAAEQAWSAAESAYNSAVERNRENTNMLVTNFAMNSTDAIAFKQMETVDNFTDRLTTHDLDALMDNAWNNLGEEGQKALIDDCYQMLRYRNPGADGLVLYNQAKEFARQQSDLRMYNLAVEKNLPKSNLEYFIRKIGDMNLVTNIGKGIAVNRVKKTGDMAAYEAANEQYRQDGHKVLDVTGMVAGFALDPTTWLSAGVGGAATRGTMWLGGRWLAGRGASTAVTQAATRQFASTMTGRIVGGIAGGAANFGTFEGIKEVENQFAHGGHIVGQDEVGRYINEGYSAGAVGGQALHGLMMGGAVGWLGPVSGNVSDQLVRATSSTLGKVSTRAGVYTGATIAEGTIFSVPEWIEGERDAMDVWNDNMSMMVGFKAKHMLTSAGGVLGDLKASFDSPTNGQKNRLDFESRLRQRMDAPSDGGFALTKDEEAELKRYGYDLRDLVESAERTGNAKDGGLIAQNAPEIVSRLTDMLADPRVSEAARAKMYYYATGRMLPMSTVMKGELIEDGNGGFIVESQGANGVITSRSFKSRKAADLELERIKRQTELNTIEIGERYQQTADFENHLQEACRTVAAENGWDMVEVYRTCEEARRNHLRGGDKQFDEVRQNILRKVTDAMGEFEETGATDAMRGRINGKYGVDIDGAIRKEVNRRTLQEQTAIDEYIAELIPEKAKEHNPIEDAQAEDITNQKFLTDDEPAVPQGPAEGEPIDPRFDDSAEAEPRTEKRQQVDGQRPVGRAVMKHQDRPVEVLSGKVVMTEDGAMVDRERSDATIVVRDSATGEVEMVSPEAILSYEDSAAPAADEVGDISAAAGTTRQPKYGKGVIKVRNSDGSETRGWLTGYVDEEGKHEYYVEGDLRRLHYATADELDSILAEYVPNEPEQSAEDSVSVPVGATAEAPQGDVTMPTGVNLVGTIAVPQRDGSTRTFTVGKDADGQNVVVDDRGFMWAHDGNGNAMRPYSPGANVPTWTDEQLSKLGAVQPANEQPTTVPNQTESVPNSEETPQNPTENAVSPAEPVPNPSQGEALPSALSRVPVDAEGNPSFTAVDAEIGWEALSEYMEGDEDAMDWVHGSIKRIQGEITKAEKALEKVPNNGNPAAFRDAKRKVRDDLVRLQSELGRWQEIKKAKVERDRAEAEQRRAEETARRRAANEAYLRRQEEIAAHEEAERSEREARKQAEMEEKAAMYAEAERIANEPANRELAAAATGFDEYMESLRDEIRQRWRGGESERALRRAENARGAKEYSGVYAELDRNGDFPSTLEEYLARALSTNKDRVRWDGPHNLGAEIFGARAGDKVGERRQYSWMLGDDLSFAELVHKLWEGIVPEEVSFNAAEVTDQDVRDAVIELLRECPTSRMLFQKAVSLRDGREAANGEAGELAELERYREELREQWYRGRFGIGADEYDASVESIYGELVANGLTEAEYAELDRIIAEETLNSERYGRRFENQVHGGVEGMSAQQTDEPGGGPAAAAGRPAPADGGIPRPVGGVPAEAVLPIAERGGQEDIRDSQRRQQGDIPQTEAGEIDERSFVLNSDGTEDFGFIDAEKADALGIGGEAPIKLQLGTDAFGLKHMKKHLAQLTANGYSSVEEFAEDICRNYKEIRQGNLYTDPNTGETKETYLLVKPLPKERGEKGGVLYIEFVPEGDVYVINSGGVFKNSYISKRKELWNASTEHSTTSGESQDFPPAQDMPESDGVSALSRSSSDHKVNNSVTEKQVSGPESFAQPSESKDTQTVQIAVEAASAEVNTEPTPAQAEAGNYKKGHVTIGEFDITIENPAGSVRKGVDADGKEWGNTMANTYGYIKGTEGVDGDHIDVFLHSDMDQWNGRKVFVVDQTNRDGSFDEHKVMLGFNDKDEAMTAYLANYDNPWADTHPGLRISETSIEDFNKWVESSHRKTKPFADYTTVSKVVDDAPVKAELEQSKQPEANIGEGYKIESKPYTNKQGKTLDTYLVTFDRDLSKEEMSALRAKAKALKGWYDRESKGWMLRSSYDAKAFAEDVTAKSEDEVADEAPLSMADMEKPKPAAKPKKAEAPAKPVEAPKPKKRRWISDEDADEFDSLRKDLRSHFGKDGDMVQEAGADYGKPKPKQMDAEVLRMGTRMTYLMMKGGLRSFSDYCEAMKDELPDIFDDMRPHLKSLYAAAQNMEEVIELGWDEEMDDRKTVKAFDVYNFDKPGAKDIIATAQHAVDENASQQQTDQIIQSLKDQRNEQRKKEADETSADTETIIDKAETTASQVESKLEATNSEEDAEGLSRSLDKELEEVNKQLALLGYYEADPVDKDFNEAYGYMRNAERKAVQDAHRLATQLAADLGITIDPKDKVRKAKYGFGSKIARSNVAPAGGEVYISLPLAKGCELSIWLSLDKNEPWRDGGRADRTDEDLMLTHIMYRVENPGAGGMSRYVSGNHNTRPTIPYDELLSDIRRLLRTYLPDEQVKPATPLVPQPGEDIVDMAKRVASDKETKAPAVEPELPIGDMFGGLFDEQPAALQPTAPAKKEMAERKSKSETSTSNSKSDEKKTDLQSRTEGTGRGGQQLRPNEPLGEGAKHEAERTDGGRMAQRSGEHSVSDSGRGAGVSGQHQSERGVTGPKNTRNNHAERGMDYAPKGEKARIDANIAALELAKKLLASGATATPQEMAILRRYSGWGGLGAAFNEGSAWAPNPVNKRLREALTPEEYQAAVMSRNSAYYTPAAVIDAMWDVAKALGFKGGNIVEGSAGIGNIIGLMPTDISERSNIHAVEIDPTTGGILSLLYPDAQVEIQGFEQTRIPNGSVDLAITNVPFVTDLHVMDESGDSDLSKKFRDIHDFCIAKNVRKLREGGIGIFITSSGTLDKSQKLRNWLVGDKEGNADVVGVFRMNNQTFGGTAATSDIIVVRKRVNGRRSANAIDVSTVTPARTATFTDARGKTKDLPLYVNRYFIEHPEHMGGEMFFGFEQGDTYRPTSIGLFPTRTADQAARMAAWVHHLADMDWSKEQGKAVAEQTSHINEALGDGVKEGSMVTDSEGNLCVARMGRAVPMTLNKNKIKGRTKEECFKDYTEIKSALAEVLKYQTEHEDDAGLQPLLDRLNRAYDTFVQRYGNLNKNNNLAWLRNDVDFSSIVALETYSEKGNKDGAKVKTYGKTDIFSRRVVEKESEPSPKNVKDGIIASIYKYGRIDTEYLATQLSKSQDDVRQEIVESGLGFVDPTTGQMEVSYEYLSGNVREKLRQAREANETAGGAYDANIKALEAVVPMNIPAHLIEFALGSSWIEPQLYERYIKERTELDVKLTNAGGTWHMSEPWNTDKPKNTEMGVRSEALGILIPGHKLIAAAITNRTITVSKQVKDPDGSHTETDPAATTTCATKVDEIRQDFKDWAREQMQNDPALSMRMEEKYNEKFNNSVPKTIPDEFVPEHFGGAATTVGGRPFKLRPHQAKAVIRATTQPVLLAHEVGTGKTYTLITTAMEMRRLGTARKPMIVVQNATVGQFVASAKALYPNAKVLTLEDADHNAEGRKAFYAKIKFNDWDMIVVPQSVLESIPDSVERQAQFIQDVIEEKMLILEKMQEADPTGNSSIVRAAKSEIKRREAELAQLASGEEPTSGKKKKDAKKAAVKRQNAEVKAREMLDRATDDVEDFDSMGIDAILVDEAHEYKHLGFATAMQRGVKGVDPSYSKKSQGVFLKTQAVLEKTGGKNVVFATGTPISNTAAEIWTFMRYLIPADVMKEYDIYYFDDFVRNFGNLQQMLEFKTNGKYDEVNRFAGYVNLPELVRIWSTVADTVLTREAGGVSDKIPQMEGGKAQDIFLPQTRALRAVMKFVREQLDAFDKMSGREKKEHRHIPLNMYGIAKAAAVDARLVQSDAEDDPDSKTNEAVRQTLRTLEETKDYKGTVAIFADNYQNKASGFNLYEDIRKKLIAAGVPEEQVVVMKSGMTVKKKLEIFDRVNAGEVRVVMGSTFTLGTGVNIQERLHTLIHLDAPNRPMDYTQRNGRILRQGNLHNTWGLPVRVLRFGVEDSLDVTAYQRLKTKGAIADSIMNGKQLMANSMENRSLEEDQDLFGDITAQLSGSEYAMLKNQIEKEVRKLRAAEKNWKADQTYIHNRKRQITGQNREAEKRIADDKSYLAKVEAATIGDITVGKLSFPSVDAMEDFFTEQNKKKAAMQEQVRTSGYSSRPATSDITISVGGFDFKIHTEITKEMKHQQGDLFATAPAKMTYSCPELGIDAMPVRGNAIKNAVLDIMENVVSGKDFRERIAHAENYLERNNAEFEAISKRDGQPFKDAEALDKAEEKLAEYEELMKAEMAAKEAKYAEMDKDVEAASGIELTVEDSEPTASEPVSEYSAENANFASSYETKDGKTINYTSENTEAYGGLFDFDFTNDVPGGKDATEGGRGDRRQQSNPPLQRRNTTLLASASDRLNEANGEYCALERKFRESNLMEFTSANKVESADDVAFIFEELENASVENVFVVMTKRGVPTVMHISIGGFNWSAMNAAPVKLAYDRIKPDKVYFVHNHPSGALNCSAQDVNCLKQIEGAIGKKAEGVIINLKSGKYGTFDSSGTYSSTTHDKAPAPADQRRLRLYTFDRHVFNPQYQPSENMRSADDVAKFLSSHRLGDRSKVSVLVCNNQNQIVANVHTTHVSVDSKGLADDIVRAIGEFGGMNAFLYGDFPRGNGSGYTTLSKAVKERSGGVFNLLDVVRIEGNNTWSARNEGYIYEPGSEYGASPEGDIRFREVEDDAVLREFAEGKTVKAYRTMQVIDGKLYSPMATKVGGKATPEIKLGMPEQAEEHPEIIKRTKVGRDGVEVGYVVIDKGLGKGTLEVAYNPSIHASRTALNDQFTSGHIRPNLVTVEVEIPISELTSGYRAKFAKDAVGEISWHSGTVSGKLADLGKPRRVILTRYDRPVRIVPFKEVAAMIAEQLNGTDIEIPYNVVQPQVRTELERLGVGISEKATGSVGEEADFGKAEYITDQEIERINAHQQEMAQTSPEAKSGHAEKLAKKFNTPVRVIVDGSKLPARLQKAKGWYDVDSGKVVVVLGNNANVEDVAETVFHEVVAHKGLREMLGEENYDAFCDDVYGHLKDDLKEEVDNDATRRFMNDPGRGYEYHRRVAVDELFGRMAEKGFEDFSKAERGIWTKLKAKVLDAINKFLGSLKLPKWVKLGDNELRYMLWRSHEKLRGKGDYVDMARDAAKREELGLNRTDVIRESKRIESIDEINKRFNEQIEHWESDEMAGNDVIEAGHPMGVMRQFMPDETITLRQKVLTKSQKKHGLTARDIKGLPGALSRPIFVFKSNPETISVLTELKSSTGQNLFVAVEVGVSKQFGHRTLEVNDILTIHGREAENIILPIVGNNTLVWVDKEKGLEWLSSAKSNSQAIAAQTLDDAAKVVKSFENPIIREGNNKKEGVSQRAMLLNESSTLTSVTDGATLSDGAKLPKFFDTPTIAEGESSEFRLRDGETGDIWNDRSVGLEERVTNAAIRLSNNQSGDLTLRNDAMRAIGGNLTSLRKAMAAQKAFDRSTVKRVADLARILMQNGYLSGMTSGETQRLISAVKNSVGRNEVRESVGKIMDIMVNNQLRNAEGALRQLLSIRGSKVDARGVEVQGVLDVDGQRTMEVVKKAMSLTEDDINDRIAEAQNRMGDFDRTIADQAALEYAGLNMALDYVQNIANSKAEEKTLRDSLKTAKEDRDAGRMTDDAYKQFVETTEDAIRKNKIERAEAYFNLVGRLSDSLRESIENAKAFRKAEKARISEIHHNANSDMEGRPTNEHHKDDWKDKFANNGFVQFLFSPLGTFDQILRVFGNKSANGEGYLWNRFMRGWVDCRNKELTGVKEKFARLDEKAAELFGKGKTWGNLIRMEAKMPKAAVSFWDGGEMRDHDLTQGNLLYIYMVDKMTDGRMKLRRMGITEEDVAEIEKILDPRFKALGDWLQDEFLVDTRNEYNETHKRMFGASMAAIENYFPLKILANARVDKEEDVNQQNRPDGITTKTGSIIKRRVNNLALDITGADALSVILDHITQMEHWNAYSEWNRDLNTLRTYKRFRNQVINMTTVYGGGRKLWENFNDLCLMAAGEYRPPVAKLDKGAVNLAKGVTAAKVSFRMFTALKQLLSAPAYIPEVSAAAIAKSIANPYGDFKWCLENMPIFRERWHSRISGDPRLLKSDMDWKMWRSRVMEISSRIGMTPNAFVDAVTVSIGARAMYETRLKQYLREGYPADAAEKRAMQDAAILFNQTQQSSESPFLSTMQVDRSWLSVLFTVFRNSSMSYTRQEFDAIRNLKRNLTPGQRAKSVEFMAKQILRDWDVDPDTAADAERDQAQSAAKNRFRRQIKKDVLRVATFGYILEWLWNLGPYLPYMFFGNDEDEKDKMWDDAMTHACFGSVEGLTGGDVMSGFGNMAVSGEWNWNQLSKDMPLASDINTIATKFIGGKNAEAVNDILNLVVQMGVGMNPQSITDAAIAITDACGDDPALSHEAAIFIMRVLQVPQSQLDKLYFDEIDMSGDEASKLTPAQLAQRYAEYKVKRGTPLAPWSWGDEERLGKYNDLAIDRMKERLDAQGDATVIEAYADFEARYKAVSQQAKEAKELMKTDYAAAAQAHAALLKDPDFALYRKFGMLDGQLGHISKMWIASKSPAEAALVASTISSYRAGMVKALQADSEGGYQSAMSELTTLMNDFYDKYQRMQPNR